MMGIILKFNMGRVNKLPILPFRYKMTVAINLLDYLFKKNWREGKLIYL